MQISNCRTNHLENPIGYEFQTPVLTWVVSNTKDQKTEWVQIHVSLSMSDDTCIYTSEKLPHVDSRGFMLPIILEPMTRYYWRVKVMGNLGSLGESTWQFFETGKMETPWEAEWVTTPWTDKTVSPYMKKAFCLSKPVETARLYIIGLGLYEAYINGHRVGDEYMTPYCNAYDGWLQYQTYDVTYLLNEGPQVLGVLLGNGWAKGKFGTFGDLNTPYLDAFALRCELLVTHTDGTVAKINSDASWLAHPSHIIEDSIYDGEMVDANDMLSDWSKPNTDVLNWKNVEIYQPKGLGPIVDRLSPPVTIQEERKPVACLKTPAGEQVLDMGQNMVGWVRFYVDEPQGTKLTLNYGEVLQDDNFYRDNLRGAKASYTFISDGHPQWVAPKFTFFGFRYVKLTGFTKPIKLENFQGCVVYTSVPIIGQLNTSNNLVNRLSENALWGQKGNFLDVPTDCPQRDERMGWTGDAQIFSGTALFNMACYPFFTKFMHDMAIEQNMMGGMVPNTVPIFMKKKMTAPGFITGGACAWGDAATIIPWNMYVHTGDKSILKRQYASMKAWVDWIRRQDVAQGDRKLWLEGFQFGDWLALDGPVEGGVFGGTETGFIASAYYHKSAKLTAQTAKVLGHLEEAEYYEQLAGDIKIAIQNEYLTRNGRLTLPTQTAHVVALYFDLVPKHQCTRVVKALVELLKANQMRLKTGFVGTPYLCRVLSEHGERDVAYDLFLRDGLPSWLYPVTMGATTIWERWDSILPNGKISGTEMNSLNHYAYGSIMEWAYRNMVGIQPLEQAPGFKNVVIRPEVCGYLSFAKGTLETPFGLLVCGWIIHKNSDVSIQLVVPFDVTVTLKLDNVQVDHIGVTTSKIHFQQEGDGVVATLLAGTYALTYTPTRAVLKRFDLDTPLWALKSYEATKTILKQYLPHVIGATNQSLGMPMPYSIQELLEKGDDFGVSRFLRGADVDAITKALGKIPYPMDGAS